MSDKRKKQKYATSREKRRLTQLSDAGRLAYGVEVPLGAVIADRSQQAPFNSYSPAPAFYVDVDFTCRDCSRNEIWTAEQQKWFYEVANGSLHAKAVRCRACRKQLNAKKQLQREQMASSQRNPG